MPGEPGSLLKTDASEELLEKGRSFECHQLQNGDLSHETCNDVMTNDTPCNNVMTNDEPCNIGCDDVTTKV